MTLTVDPERPALTGEPLRDRCRALLEEVRGAASDEDAIDALVAVLTQLQAARLSADDRRGLAAIYGYELGRDDAHGEAAQEVANCRRLLERHGVREADGLGVLRSTVVMLEEALIARPPRRT